MNALAINSGGEVCPEKFRATRAARALAPRTYLGKLRIAEDTTNHFGHPARFVVVQTIMNATACSESSKTALVMITRRLRITASHRQQVRRTAYRSRSFPGPGLL